MERTSAGRVQRNNTETRKTIQPREGEGRCKRDPSLQTGTELACAAVASTQGGQQVAKGGLNAEDLERAANAVKKV